MKNTTKLLFCGIGLILFGIIYQALIGNNGSWIVGGILLFGIGFGWYASKSKQDELTNER